MVISARFGWNAEAPLLVDNGLRRAASAARATRLTFLVANNIGRKICGKIAVEVWYSVPGTLLLYGAVATHFLLALWVVYERRSDMHLAAEYESEAPC